MLDKGLSTITMAGGSFNSIGQVINSSSPLSFLNGGTGVSNNSTLTWTPSNNIIFRTTGPTDVTFPTSGTLITSADTNLLPTGTHIWSVINGTMPGFLLEDGTAYAVQNNLGNTVTAYPDLFAAIFTSGGYAFGTGQNGFINSTPGSTNTVLQQWNNNSVSQPTPNYDAATSGFTFVQGTSGGFANVTISNIAAGSSITPGSYYRLLVNTTGPQFVQLFWFSVDGVGTIPAVGYDVAIQINFLSSQTAASVAATIATYANGLFQVPDVQGLFIRGWDNGAGNDTGASTRTGSGFSGSGNTGDEIGSFQVSGVGSHTHISSSGQVFATLGGAAAADGVTASGVTRFLTSTLSNITGTVFPSQGDTRPPNVYFNGFIKT